MREAIRPLTVSKIGDGTSISAWFDCWCSLGNLHRLISCRHISYAGFPMQATVSDVVDNQGWRFLPDWFTRFDFLNNIQVPTLRINTRDRVLWRYKDTEYDFFSSIVWHSIREVGNEVDWCEIVWFSYAIPRDAFIVWLIMGQKLKTQDKLREWDINPHITHLCPLCSLHEESHPHLFFECSYSFRVWESVRNRALMDRIPRVWSMIIDELRPLSKKKVGWNIIGKLLLGAVAYFVWQERNLRLLKKRSRSRELLSRIIVDTVRLRVSSIRFKDPQKAMLVLHRWDLKAT